MASFISTTKWSPWRLHKRSCILPRLHSCKSLIIYRIHNSISSVLIFFDLLVNLWKNSCSLTWFSSFLQDRFQRLALQKFSFISFTTGLLHFDAFLFSLYTKSQGSVIKYHGFSYHWYADDTQIFTFFYIHLTSQNISDCLFDIRWPAFM